MVNLKGRFKGETGRKLHMLPLANDTNLGIEARIWVGILFKVIVGEDKRLGVWVLQRYKG